MSVWASSMRWFYTRAGAGALAEARRLRDKGDYVRAEAEFARANGALSKGLPREHSWIKQAIANRAWCTVKLGRPKAAVKLYRQVLDLVTANGETEYAKTLRAQLQWAKDEAASSPGQNNL